MLRLVGEKFVVIKCQKLQETRIKAAKKLLENFQGRTLKNPSIRALKTSGRLKKNHKKAFKKISLLRSLIIVISS